MRTIEIKYVLCYSRYVSTLTREAKLESKALSHSGQGNFVVRCAFMTNDWISGCTVTLEVIRVRRDHTINTGGIMISQSVESNFLSLLMKIDLVEARTCI